MAGLIQTLTFTNTAGNSFDFLGTGSRVSAWEPSNRTRGETRPRMQAHGANPRVPYFGELPIHQEGFLVSSTAGSALIAQRDSFNRVVMGDLSASGTATLSGTLVVKFEGWSESAHQTVLVEVAEAKLRVENGRQACAYMVDWVAVIPYFVGSSSGSAYLV